MIRIHRWLGVGCCWLIGLWFLSGFVMLYVAYPKLSAEARCAHLDPLPSDGWRLSPSEAFSATGLTKPPISVRLGSFKEAPVYYFKTALGGKWICVRADNGQVLREVSLDDALAVARRFLGLTRLVGDVRPVDFDQWTLPDGLNSYRPFYRVDVQDAAGTEVYVSRHTGEVVLETSRRERVLNYFGSVIHWVYPTILRKHLWLWRISVSLLIAFVTVSPLTGGIVAILRTRWKRVRAGQPRVPYRGWLRWHYLLGLEFGAFTVVWLVTGLLTMDVVKDFDKSGPTAAQVERFAGGAVKLEDFRVPPSRLLAASKARLLAKEGEMVQFAGAAYYLLRAAPGKTLLARADREGPLQFRGSLPEARLTQAAAALIPDAAITAAEAINKYDFYYYPRIPQDLEKPLPVLLMKFNDLAETWFYINPRTLQIVARLSHTTRTYRNVVTGLHNWDWPMLVNHRPLWDIVTCLLMLGGLAGVLEGFRYVWKWFGARVR
jgi:hypothetical protein